MYTIEFFLTTLFGNNKTIQKFLENKPLNKNHANKIVILILCFK